MTAGREALIVAVDDYADPGLSALRAPRRDADALGDVLGDPRIGDFEVRVLRNESAQAIREAIEDFFAERQPDDLLLLHFSCHGLKNAAGELYLAAADSRPTRLASTAVAADFVNQQMADSRAQRIALFLDCCYGGAFPRGMVVRGSTDVEVGNAFAAAQEAAGGRGRVVVTASSSVEYAFEGADLAPGAQVEPSVFTGSVVEGLSTGAADRDGDGWVGLNELFTFVAERVRRATPHQTPHLWAFGSEGDLLLARSRRRRIEAGDLPSELVGAARSSLPATRYGVAAELRERLLGNDLGQALAAWQVLKEMADDDSRRVSMLVAEVMSDAELQITPPTLDLGTSPVGVPITADVQLAGCPLVLVATADSADQWLSGEVEATALHVRVEPGPAGTREGALVITTPIGEHVLPVRVEVTERKRLPTPRAPSGRQQPRPSEKPTPDVSRSAQPAPREEKPRSSAKPRREREPQREGHPVTSARVWWPVLVALCVAAIAGFGAYDGLSYLYYNPNGSNLDQRWYDSFGATLVAVPGFLVASLVWPRLSLTALGVAAGVGVSLVGWATLYVFSDAAQSDSSLSANWTRLLVTGFAMIVVVVFELARRRALLGALRWRSPGVVATCLLVVGVFLNFWAETLTFNGVNAVKLSGAAGLVLPLLRTILTGLVLLTTVGGDRGRVARAAAVALLAASFAINVSLSLRLAAPVCVATYMGSAVLLAGLAADHWKVNPWHRPAGSGRLSAAEDV